MFNKILVALDDTEFAHIIFEEGLVLAQKLEAHLMLLHVLAPMDTNHFGLQPGGIGIEGFFPILNEQAVNQYMKEWQNYEQQGLIRLQAYEQEARGQGVQVEFTQNIGDPGQVICEFAKNWSADLILTGRSRKSGISEMLLGSSSNYVLHHAPCSVMTIQSTVPAPPSPTQNIGTAMRNQ